MRLPNPLRWPGKAAATHDISRARHGLVPDRHWDLSGKGLRKRRQVDFDPVDAARLEPERHASFHALGVRGRSPASKSRLVPQAAERMDALR